MKKRFLFILFGGLMTFLFFVFTSTAAAARTEKQLHPLGAVMVVDLDFSYVPDGARLNPVFGIASEFSWQALYSDKPLVVKHYNPRQHFWKGFYAQCEVMHLRA